jgi:hypothetical protein
MYEYIEIANNSQQVFRFGKLDGFFDRLLNLIKHTKIRLLPVYGRAEVHVTAEKNHGSIIHLVVNDRQYHINISIKIRL